MLLDSGLKRGTRYIWLRITRGCKWKAAGDVPYSFVRTLTNEMHFLINIKLCSHLSSNKNPIGQCVLCSLSLLLSWWECRSTENGE